MAIIKTYSMHYNNIMRQWIGLSHNGQPLYNVTDVVLVVQHTGHDQISNTYSTQVSFITTVLILATSFKEQLILAFLQYCGTIIRIFNSQECTC